MTARFCTRCGEPTRTGAAYCEACGESFDVAAPPTASLPAQGETVVASRSRVRPEDLALLGLSAGLLVIGSSRVVTEVFELDKKVTSIGRGSTSDIFLDDASVSRRHAEVVRGAMGFTFVDQGSLNGTYVNGVRVDEAVVLRHGDQLRVGRFRLLFVAGAPTASCGT